MFGFYVIYAFLIWIIFYHAYVVFNLCCWEFAVPCLFTFQCMWLYLVCYHGLSLLPEACLGYDGHAGTDSAVFSLAVRKSAGLLLHRASTFARLLARTERLGTARSQWSKGLHRTVVLLWTAELFTSSYIHKCCLPYSILRFNRLMLFAFHISYITSCCVIFAITIFTDAPVVTSAAFDCYTFSHIPRYFNQFCILVLP